MRGIDLLELFEQVDASRAFSIIEEILREDMILEQQSEGTNKTIMAKIRDLSRLDDGDGSGTKVNDEGLRVIDNFVQPDEMTLQQLGFLPPLN